MTRRTVLLLAWVWVVVAFATYLVQFRELLGPILRLVGGG